MKKKILIALTLCLVMIGILAAPALADKPVGAGAGKAFLYDNPAYTLEDGALPGADDVIVGFVILNTNASGDLIAEISIKDGAPNTAYQIWVNQWEGDCPTTPTGTLMTNANGKGNAHVVEVRVAGATKFWVSATSATPVLRSPAVVLD